jgi:hypothetical protein
MNSQGNLNKKRTMLEITQNPTSNYTRVIAIKTAWYLHKNRYEDKTSVTE